MGFRAFAAHVFERGRVLDCPVAEVSLLGPVVAAAAAQQNTRVISCPFTPIKCFHDMPLRCEVEVACNAGDHADNQLHEALCTLTCTLTVLTSHVSSALCATAHDHSVIGSSNPEGHLCVVGIVSVRECLHERRFQDTCVRQGRSQAAWLCGECCGARTLILSHSMLNTSRNSRMWLHFTPLKCSSTNSRPSSTVMSSCNKPPSPMARMAVLAMPVSSRRIEPV